jgi:hypothetical protein
MHVPATFAQDTVLMCLQGELEPQCDQNHNRVSFADSHVAFAD